MFFVLSLFQGRLNMLGTFLFGWFCSGNKEEDSYGYLVKGSAFF